MNVDTDLYPPCLSYEINRVRYLKNRSASSLFHPLPLYFSGSSDPVQPYQRPQQIFFLTYLVSEIL